jgi:mannose-6-phosphate isomerase-like protein (cupin superfamily)
MTTGRPEPIVIAPSEGRSIPRPDTGGRVVIKVSRDQSSGAMTVYESSRETGDRGGPPRHAHAGFDEFFYVLDGAYDFAFGERNVLVRKGSCVFIPRGAWHGFRSAGSEPGRLLTVCTPGGIEQFFEEVARQPTLVGDIAASHGFDSSRWG